MNLNKRLIFLLFALVVIPLDINAQALSRVELTVDEQRRLAAQYGVTEESSALSGLGVKANPIIPEGNQRSLQRLELGNEFTQMQKAIGDRNTI